MPLWFRNVVAGVLCASLTACAVHRSKPVALEDAPAQLSAGDRITVRLKTGRTFKAIVKEVTASELVTKRNRYAWSKIRSVSLEEADAGATLLGGLGALGLAAVMFAGVAMWQMSEEFGD